jgi:hypothetical protein
MNRWFCTTRRRQCWALTAGFVASALLLAVESGFSQDTRPKSDARGDALRRIREAKAFFALPPERQEAMRKLDEELNKLPPGERKRLLRAMRWYADWLDKLSPQDREAIVNTPDRGTRLTKIKEHLHQEWMARQPQKTRDLLAKLPPGKRAAGHAALNFVGMLATPPSQRPLALAVTLFIDNIDVRGETIKRIKQHEAQQNRDWLVASRFWPDLTDPDAKKRQPMPAHAGDFGPDVEAFVRDYLRPALSKEEKERLDKAEGHWPQYPMTLVDLADKHPMALPQTHGPETFNDLPKAITDKVTARWETKDKKGGPKVAPEVWFKNQANSKGIKERLEKMERNPSLATRLACSVANYLHARKVDALPHELWAVKYSDLAAPMKAFLDPDGPFLSSLDEIEREEMRQVQFKWPEYPLKIKQLAEKYGFKPPWQSLPEPSDTKHRWDNYRVRAQHRVQSQWRWRQQARLESQPRIAQLT